MRNMMGLLGNVAEVKELRSGLIPFVNIFYELVDSLQDGIEVRNQVVGKIGVRIGERIFGVIRRWTCWLTEA
jgi:hypothetical protein